MLTGGSGENSAANLVHAHWQISLPDDWASLGAQLIKNPPAMQETWVQFLGREDPPEKKMTMNSSILAWRIPWTEAPGRLQSIGSLTRVEHKLATKPPNHHKL